jgi:acyl-CoA dehydrogenase
MSVAVDRDQAFLATIRRIADEVAAPNADDVDRNARFPQETIDALKAERALSAFIPEAYDGGGISLETIAAACFELGRRCGASAMVFAMHNIKVASVVRHVEDSPAFQAYLRDVSREQRLVASVTSEIGTGGDMGRSIAAVTPDVEGRATFEKQAPTVSYAAYADDLLTTLRRAPDAEPGDQVLVLTRRGEYTLEQTGTWDPMGMRGTCSPGYVVRGDIPVENVMPVPFSTIGPESMVPISHILWSHLWLGIATDAFDRARAFVRASARNRPDVVPPTAAKLSLLMSELSLLRAEVSTGLRDWTDANADGNRESLTTMAMILRFNNLKIAASDQAPRVCQGAMSVCGIVGYKNDTPYSVGRHLRDSMSACLMVANDRIHQTNASLLLIAKDV